MILTSVLAAGALSLAWPPIALPHSIEIPTAGMRRRAEYKVRTKSYHVSGWEMRITRDGFTGQVRCRLWAPGDLKQVRMSYAQGTVGFHFSHDRDVAQAWYSVDDAPPRRWRDDFPVLIARGIQLQGQDLANPTDGIVLIDARGLAEARTVTIRPDRDGAPKRFKLKGFALALEAAKANGCQTDATFERER